MLKWILAGRFSVGELCFCETLLPQGGDQSVGHSHSDTQAGWHAALRGWHSDLAFDWQGSKWQQHLEAFGSDPDENTHTDSQRDGRKHAGEYARHTHTHAKYDQLRSNLLALLCGPDQECPSTSGGQLRRKSTFIDINLLRFPPEQPLMLSVGSNVLLLWMNQLTFFGEQLFRDMFDVASIVSCSFSIQCEWDPQSVPLFAKPVIAWAPLHIPSLHLSLR